MACLGDRRWGDPIAVVCKRRPFLDTGLRRYDGIKRGWLSWSLMPPRSRQARNTVTVRVTRRHSGAGRNPETTSGAVPCVEAGIGLRRYDGIKRGWLSGV